MSALNVCHKPDRAIIMRDAACYDRDGVIIDFVEKGREIPEMGCFVACTGARVAIELMARLLPKFFADIDAVAEGEADLQAIYDRSEDWLADRGSRGLSLIVAGWSAKLDRPRIVLFSCGGDKGTGFGSDVGNMQHPILEGPARSVWETHHGIGQINIQRFDPLSDGVFLMELQRRQIFDRGLRYSPAYLVGGFIALTEVRRDGISTNIVHRWPEDRVGERIRPKPLATPTANVTPMNRAERRRQAKIGKAAA